MTPPTGDSTQQDAFASVQQLLGQYGLSSLADFAWREITKDRTETEVLQDLRAQPEFKARFPGIAEREKAGLPPISPGEYVSMEQSYTQVLRAAGLPKGFFDQPSDFTDLIAKDVSVSELNQRVQQGYVAASQAPAELRQQLTQLYGVSPGELAAYYLDPDRALPLLLQQQTAAGEAGAAQRTGFGQLTRDEAEQLAAQGVTPMQAQAGFSTLTAQQELFNALPGQNENQIDRSTQFGAEFGGNAEDQTEIERRAGARRSAFGTGGGFGGGQQTGVGEAQGA